MKWLRFFRISAVWHAFGLPLAVGPGQFRATTEAAPDPSAFEVWVIDQSDTVADGGGTLAARSTSIRTRR